VQFAAIRSGSLCCLTFSTACSAPSTLCGTIAKPVPGATQAIMP
jgi:hypothetical protein